MYKNERNRCAHFTLFREDMLQERCQGYVFQRKLKIRYSRKEQGILCVPGTFLTDAFPSNEVDACTLFCDEQCVLSAHSQSLKEKLVVYPLGYATIQQ